MLRPPKPRLRQVFEHTTSFKVTGPSGKQITIAKKGLSPSTVGRLRRFAQGGEVRGYDDGGEVTEPVNEPLAEMPQIAPEALTPQAAAPVTEEAAPVQPRRVVTQAMLDEEARRQAAASAAPPVAALTPVAPTAPTAPVVVNVTTAPQPVAPQPAPQKMEAAPVATKDTSKAKSEAAPKVVESQSVLSAAEEKWLESKDMDFAYDYGMARSEGMSIEQASDFAARQRLARTSAASRQESMEAGTQPAPARKPSVPITETAVQPPIAVAPLPAPQPVVSSASVVESPVAPPVTVGGIPRPEAPAFEVPVTESTTAVPTVVREEPSRPVTAPASVAAPPPAAPPAAPPTAVTPTPVAPLQAPTRPFAGVSRAALAPAAAVAPLRMDGLMTDAEIDAATESLPEYMRDAARLTMRAQRDERAAIMREEQVNRQQLAEQAKQAQEEQRAALNKIEQIQATRNNLLAQVKEAREEGDLASRMPWYQKIGTVLALAVSGFAAGYTGTPNYALAAFDKQLERDLERQKRRQDSLFSELKAVTGSEDLAVDMYKSIAKEMVAIKAQEASMLATSDRSRAAYAKLSAEFLLDARRSAADIELKAAQTEGALAAAAGQLTAQEKIALELSKIQSQNQIRSLERARLNETIRAHKAAEEAREKNASDRAEKERRERILNVGGVEVELPRKQTATKMQKELAFRSSGVRAMDDLINLMETTSTLSLANKFSDDHVKATALLKDLKESYAGMAQGSDRAISYNAAKVVEEALQNPLSLVKLGLGQKTVALKASRDAFKKARETFIRTIAMPGQDLGPALKSLAEEDAMFAGDVGFEPAGGK